MATTKLTLSISKDLLKEAKLFSEETQQSLSSLVSRYFSLLSIKLKPSHGKDFVSPRVRRVTGIAKSGKKKDQEILFEAFRAKYL